MVARQALREPRRDVPVRAERVVERAGGEDLLQRGAGVLEHGRRGLLPAILLVRVARLAQGHDVDLFDVARTREGVPDRGEVIPHGRRQAVEVDFVDPRDRLWRACRRSGVPDLRGGGNHGKEEICRQRFRNLSRDRGCLLTHHP